MISASMKLSKVVKRQHASLFLFFVESSEVLEPETNRNVKRNTMSSREFTKLDCLSASLCGSGKFSAVLLSSVDFRTLTKFGLVSAVRFSKQFKTNRKLSPNSWATVEFVTVLLAALVARVCQTGWEQLS